MIGLAIHTSSPELGLALTDFRDVQRHQVWPLGRDLTAYLHTCLKDFIQPYAWQALAFLAVSIGPGGFTGTRIGVTVARTLAQQLDIPLFGISSLAAIAQQHCQQHCSLQVGNQNPAPHLAIAMKAQRGELYGAIYERRGAIVEAVRPVDVYTQPDWTHLLQSWSHAYEGVTVEGGLAASVTEVLALAQVQWHLGDRPAWQTVLPFYGQHPVNQ